jgi:hypothetical protein
MPDEAIQQAAQAVLEASTPKPNTIKDIFKLVYNAEREFSAIAIHAGPNKNHWFYDAENLAQIANTQEGQSVTLGHDIYAVGTVTHAVWDPVGDEHGAKMDVRFIIQNHPQILEAIKAGKITQVSTTTNYDKAWCAICNEEAETCEHIPGQEYDGKVAVIRLNVTNFGPLALVGEGADVNSVIYNRFIGPKKERLLMARLSELETRVNELQKVEEKPPEEEKKKELIKKLEADTGKALNVPSKEVPKRTLADILPPKGLKRRVEKKGDRMIYWHED